MSRVWFSKGGETREELPDLDPMTAVTVADWRRGRNTARITAPERLHNRAPATPPPREPGPSATPPNLQELARRLAYRQGPAMPAVVKKLLKRTDPGPVDELPIELQKTLPMYPRFEEMPTRVGPPPANLALPVHDIQPTLSPTPVAAPPRHRTPTQISPRPPASGSMDSRNRGTTWSDEGSLPGRVTAVGSRTAALPARRRPPPPPPEELSPATMLALGLIATSVGTIALGAIGVTTAYVLALLH
jgi:hypothetical protein